MSRWWLTRGEGFVMRTRLTMAVGATVLAAATLVGASAAVAGGNRGDDGDRGDRWVTGVAGAKADKAAAAALSVTGGGRVNSVERDREKGAVWEVEITRPDGVTVDVRLDAYRRLVVVDSDGEDANSPSSSSR